MKIIFSILAFIFFMLPVSAIDFVCPVQAYSHSDEHIQNETGMFFVSKYFVEGIIEQELAKIFNSKINANLDIYNNNRLKNGEFKSLKLSAKKINYNNLMFSDFSAETACPYNKVVIKNKRVYYPVDLPFYFTSTITNEDLSQILKSSYVQNMINDSSKTTIKVGSVTLAKAGVPDIKIIDDKLNYTIPVKTIIGEINLLLKSDIDVEDNTIMLKNIEINALNRYFPYSDETPKFKLDFLNNRHGKLNITNIKISGNMIILDGVYIMNKNYTGYDE